MKICPLENTKHFDACAISNAHETCSFKRTCAEMLEDSLKFEGKKAEEPEEVSQKEF